MEESILVNLKMLKIRRTTKTGATTLAPLVKTAESRTLLGPQVMLEIVLHRLMLAIRATIYLAGPTTKKTPKEPFAAPSKAVGAATYSKNRTIIIMEVRIRLKQATSQLCLRVRTWARRSPLRPPQAKLNNWFWKMLGKYHILCLFTKIIPLRRPSHSSRKRWRLGIWTGSSIISRHSKTSDPSRSHKTNWAWQRNACHRQKDSKSSTFQRLLRLSTHALRIWTRSQPTYITRDSKYLSEVFVALRQTTPPKTCSTSFRQRRLKIRCGWSLSIKSTGKTNLLSKDSLKKATKLMKSVVASKAQTSIRKAIECARLTTRVAFSPT